MVILFSLERSGSFGQLVWLYLRARRSVFLHNLFGNNQNKFVGSPCPELPAAATLESRIADMRRGRDGFKKTNEK